jgi:hypothetical protein
MKTSQEQLVEQIVKQIQEQILSEEFGKPSRATNCEDYQSSTTNQRLTAIEKKLDEIQSTLKDSKEEDTSYWATHQPDTGCANNEFNPFSPI